MEKDKKEFVFCNSFETLEEYLEEFRAYNINMMDPSTQDYYGKDKHIVSVHPDGFQGWVDFDETNPVWQMKCGTYVPLSIMEDDHLVACYRMINEKMIKKNDWLDEEEHAVIVKWEEVLFDEANKRYLVTKLYD